MSVEARAFRMVRRSEARAAEEILSAEGYGFEAEPFWDMAHVLTNEPAPLGSSLAAAFGLIYIQDRSSMLPPLLLDPKPGDAVLDLCSAPGGKTGIAASLVGRNGMVLANEPSAKRLAVLRRNLLRMAEANVAACSRPGESIPLAEGTWRKILLDPPCSGWGAENRHPEVRTRWRGERIEPMIRLQRSLLERSAALLAPGGSLMYSTCTTNPDENEAQVRYAVEELGLELRALRQPPGVALSEPSDPLCSKCLCVAGGEGGGQGFFLALLAGPDGQEPGPPPRTRIPGRAPTKAEREALSFCDFSRLPPGELRIFGDVAAWAHEMAGVAPPDLRLHSLPLGRIKAGRFLVEPRARMLVPKDGAVRVIDVDEIAPLSRLLAGRGIEVDASRGFFGLAFRGTPLGWLSVKNGRALWTAKP